MHRSEYSSHQCVTKQILRLAVIQNIRVLYPEIVTDEVFMYDADARFCFLVRTLRTMGTLGTLWEFWNVDLDVFGWRQRGEF